MKFDQLTLVDASLFSPEGDYPDVAPSRLGKFKEPLGKVAAKLKGPFQRRAVKDQRGRTRVTSRFKLPFAKPAVQQGDDCVAYPSSI